MLALLHVAKSFFLVEANTRLWGALSLEIWASQSRSSAGQQSDSCDPRNRSGTRGTSTFRSDQIDQEGQNRQLELAPAFGQPQINYKQAGARAAVDSISVRLIAIASPDHETAPQYTLLVEVRDNGQPRLTDTAEIVVVVNDVNEPPIIADQSFDIAENSAAGTIVGEVIAADVDDGDTIGFSIIDGNDNGIFAIDPDTGILTLTRAPNHEEYAEHELTIQVTDNGVPPLTDEAVIIVRVIDVNEVLTIEPQTFAIAENSASGTSVGTVVANDVDDGDMLSFTITAGNLNDAFAIDPASGEIRVAGFVDHETLNHYQLVIEVADDGVPSLSANAEIVITIDDVNEAPVVSAHDFDVDENSPAGTIVGNVEAIDVDDGDALTYNIVAGNIGNTFAIDAATGTITVTLPPDHETVDQFALTIRATDNGAPPLSDDETIVIVINDVNEAPNLVAHTFHIPENSGSGTVVGTVAATDVDDGDTFVYEVVAGENAAVGGVFNIGGESGIIAVAGALDHESLDQYELTVRVTDTGTPPLANQAMITILVDDVNEAPTIDDQQFQIDENAAAGTTIGIVLASDVDDWDSLEFAIVGGNDDGFFAIQPVVQLSSRSDEVSIGGETVRSESAAADVPGRQQAEAKNSDDSLNYKQASARAAVDSISVRLYANASLDHESDGHHILTVQVVDHGQPRLTDTAEIVVIVTDVNEPPVVELQVFSVEENMASGTTVDFVEATDPDEGDVVFFAIVGGNIGTAFRIDGITGELTVHGLLDREGIDQYALTIEVQDNGMPSLRSRAFVIVVVDNVNEAPVVVLPNGSAVLSYPVSIGPIVIDPAATVIDLDSADFAGGELTIRIVANATADDRLLIVHQGSGAGEIGVQGNEVRYGSVIIGTYSGGAGTTPLVVALNEHASPSSVRSLLRAIAYENVSGDPSTLPRTVEFTLSDDDGATSSPVTRVIAVKNVSYDIDGNGIFDALTDGVSIVRYIAGMIGPELVADAVGSGCERCDAVAILEFLDRCRTHGAFDVNGDGVIDVGTDGVIILRYLFGFRSAILIAGLDFQGAPRGTPAQIEVFLGQFSR